ncbi:unnamed protein product, partial [Didymodactylos carnosus]
MKEGKNNLNNSIKDYLNNRNILSDLQVLIDDRNISVDANISSKPVKEWTKEDIQNWSKKVKDNKLLFNKQQVQDAIVVVSQEFKHDLFNVKQSIEKELQF